MHKSRSCIVYCPHLVTWLYGRDVCFSYYELNDVLCYTYTLHGAVMPMCAQV